MRDFSRIGSLVTTWSTQIRVRMTQKIRFFVYPAYSPRSRMEQSRSASDSGDRARVRVARFKRSNRLEEPHPVIIHVGIGALPMLAMRSMTR